MRGNINKVRGPIPSLRSGGSRETYVTTSVWFGKTPSARDKATIDQVDTRAGSVKRVASAVGEGAMAVHLVHRFLAESTYTTQHEITARPEALNV